MTRLKEILKYYNGTTWFMVMVLFAVFALLIWLSASVLMGA